MSRARLLAAVAVTTLALTSCSLFGGSEPTGPTKSAPHITQPQGVYLSSNSTAQLGTTVIDAVGYTLYFSDKDSAKPSKSACDATCAQTWKPVPYTDPVVVEGLDQAKIGKVARDDGSEQVTIAGWPVYTKVGEQTGSVASNGKDGWFAITPDGRKAAKPK